MPISAGTNGAKSRPTQTWQLGSHVAPPPHVPSRKLAEGDKTGLSLWLPLWATERSKCESRDKQTDGGTPSPPPLRARDRRGSPRRGHTNTSTSGEGLGVGGARFLDERVGEWSPSSSPHKKNDRAGCKHGQADLSLFSLLAPFMCVFRTAGFLTPQFSSSFTALPYIYRPKAGLIFHGYVFSGKVGVRRSSLANHHLLRKSRVTKLQSASQNRVVTKIPTSKLLAQPLH